MSRDLYVQSKEDTYFWSLVLWNEDVAADLTPLNFQEFVEFQNAALTAEVALHVNEVSTHATLLVTMRSLPYFLP